jgi:hypothetical protein
LHRHRPPFIVRKTSSDKTPTFAPQRQCSKERKKPSQAILLCKVSPIAPGDTPAWQLPSSCRKGIGLRPFTPWREIQDIFFVDHLEALRFTAQPLADQARRWDKRRRHAPHDERIPGAMGLDSIYLRHAEENEYCERLQLLEADMSCVSVSTDLVSMAPLWVYFLWPMSQHPTRATSSMFPTSGDVADAKGSDVALDSSWCLREASLQNGNGDCGKGHSAGRYSLRTLASGTRL